jgi:DNA-binding CsgD family transcriptional regulator
LPRITRRDYEALLACIERLYGCESLERFYTVALEAIEGLVGSDHSTLNYLAPTVPKAIVLTSHQVPDHAGAEATFAKYLAGHPILQHYLATGDPGPHKVSDFLSVRDYHALPLYKHLYHGLGYEDQLAFMLFPPPGELVAISLARDRRSFTERDRQVLDLVRPHAARAFRHVEQLTLIKRSLEGRAPSHRLARVTSVLLDDRNRPIQFGVQAEKWLRRFFPGRPRPPGLPGAVTEWLRAARIAPTAATGAAGNLLVRERDGLRLRLRLFPGWSGAARMLVLETEPTAQAAHAAWAGNLTPREVDVLLVVEQGRTNEEAAAALGISPLTVRAHLEHIFEKLDVHTRTGAVTRFRQSIGFVPGGDGSGGTEGS